MFANTQGIYSLLGGAVEKVSEPLDNLFFTQNFIADQDLRTRPAGNFYPSAAVATLFAQPCYLLLMPIINPTNNNIEKQLLMWNGRPGGDTPQGKWWTATQSIDLIFVSGLESDSTLYAYGTDGNSIYQMFNTNSELLPKIVQSRLWIDPTIVMEKKGWGLYALYECYNDTDLTFTCDTEGGTFDIFQGDFVGGGSENIPNTVWAKSIAPAPAGQVIGFTMNSTSVNFALLDIVLISQDYVLET
jgi:hypothetical protein